MKTTKENFPALKQNLLAEGWEIECAEVWGDDMVTSFYKDDSMLEVSYRREP